MACDVAVWAMQVLRVNLEIKADWICMHIPYRDRRRILCYCQGVSNHLPCSRPHCQMSRRVCIQALAPVQDRLQHLVADVVSTDP